MKFKAGLNFPFLVFNPAFFCEELLLFFKSIGFTETRLSFDLSKLIGFEENTLSFVLGDNCTTFAL
jgi:hypothetical protein